jgi:hypothetical protein
MKQTRREAKPKDESFDQLQLQLGQYPGFQQDDERDDTMRRLLEKSHKSRVYVGVVVVVLGQVPSLHFFLHSCVAPTTGTG